MPTYREWNDALIEHFTYGAPIGSTIYLDISDASVDRIGQQTWGGAPAEGWVADYIQAIQDELVEDGCVFLGSVWENDSRGRPEGVAFLGALVLVATRMDTDEEQQISQNDYMTRLNELLGTVPANSQVRRPKHMQTGKEGEEPLWLAWAAYLRGRGYQPTAAGGIGAWKYIGYAVSQTLFRAHEKRKLERIFSQQQWGDQPEGEFMARQLRYLDGVPAHVQKLLNRQGQAAEDVFHALEEVYQEWRFNRETVGGARDAQFLSRNLVAGLYRTEHYRTGEVQYALFPRQPRGLRLLEIEVGWADGPEPLVVERPGYYAPLGELDGERLTDGLTVTLLGHPQLDELKLPARTFWILRTDPDNPDSCASLGRPGVGEHFLLLVRDSLSQDLEALREQGLMQWERQERWQGDWREYHGVMVTANHWQDAHQVDRDLVDGLRPEAGFSLSLTGGLRVPGRGAWLAAGPPQVSVGSFFTETFLTLKRGSEELFSEQVEPNQPVSLPWSEPGDYQLEVESRGQGQVRLVKLLDWEELPTPEPGLLGAVSKSWRHGERYFELRGADVECSGGGQE